MEHAKTSMPRRPVRAALLLASAALIAALAPTMPALAQAQAQIAISANAYGAVRSLELELNKSMLVDLPAGVAEVVVSQPNIAAAIMRSRTRAIVQGMQEGATNIIFLDDAGRTISVLDMRVVQPPLAVGEALQDTLRRVIPGSNIKVETLSNTSLNDKIYFVLTGTVRTAEDKAIAEAMASQLSESDGPTGSLIQVTGAQQVMLQVTVSEIRRDVAKQLGINLSGNISVGNVNLGFNSIQTDAPNGISGSFPLANGQINASIRALEERGALRLLAQPTLTAMSGQSAEFLVGGEFPIPVLDANNRTTVTYKPYGIELNFKPVLRSNGMVALDIDTGVSEVQAGSYALSRRDVKTSVELPPGSTLAIGGLLDERASRAVDQLPGLANIPILGALFRSNGFRSQQTELVILVTPYLVNPSPVNSIAVPTDHSLIGGDAEAVFLGKLEHMYGVGATGEFRSGYSGSVGFVLD